MINRNFISNITFIIITYFCLNLLFANVSHAVEPEEILPDKKLEFKIYPELRFR